MIPIRELRQRAGEALAYLKTVPEVEEAEVFMAANAILLARLNYASHIPSGGVEEPKSTQSYGVGIRLVFKTPEGVRKTGFSAEPSDLSLAGVGRALEKARKGAVHDPEFVSLPRPTGERRTLARNSDLRLMRIKEEDLVGIGWVTLEEALEVFSSSEELLNLAGRRELVPQQGLIVGGDVTLLQERVAIASHALPRVQSDESTLAMAFITGMVEKQRAKGSGMATANRLADYTGEAGAEAARNAVRSIGGVRVPSGQYRVVLGRQPVTDLLHNIILPSLNLGLFYASASPFLGKLGKQVASERLSLYDDGAAPGLVASKGITCEGLPTGRTELIRHGQLVGLLTDYYESQRILRDPKARGKLGVNPQDYPSAFVPRNGFRFARGGGRHFDSPPFTAPTNVIVEGNEPLSQQEMLRRVGNGLYIGRIWYTYPINGIAAGDFTCTVVGDSYIIRDGRLAEPIQPNTLRLNDSIHAVLNGILGVGTERRGTLVWATDEIVHAAELAVEKLTVQAIAEFMEGV